MIRLLRCLDTVLRTETSPETLAKPRLGGVGTALESGFELMMKTLGWSDFVFLTLEFFSVLAETGLDFIDIICPPRNQM